MKKPQLQEYGLTDNDYYKLKDLPKLIEKRFINIGAIIGVLTGVVLFLFFPHLGMLLYGAWIGLILGSILFYIIGVLLSDYLSTKNKIYAKLLEYDNDLRSYLKTQKDYWKSLTGKEFEKELANIYDMHGYTTELTPSSGDQGIDIILNKNGIKKIVQCKAHSKPVGPATVRDLYGTLIASKAHTAILASTSGFTKGVYTFVKGKRIELVDLDTILQLSEDVMK
jgi:hypothetical protein